MGQINYGVKQAADRHRQKLHQVWSDGPTIVAADAATVVASDGATLVSPS